MPENIILTSQQREQLKEKCNTLAPAMVARYVIAGAIALSELPLEDARRAAIEQIIETAPNPKEQQDWAKVKNLEAACDMQNVTALRSYLAMLDGYLSVWQSAQCNGNHVADAQREKANILEKIQALQAAEEVLAWQNVNLFDMISIEQYVLQYPQSSHLKELENSYWNLVPKELLDALQKYITLFPQGEFVSEAKERIGAYQEWTSVSTTRDLRQVARYVRNHPNSPFIQEAQLLLLSLKQQEFVKMKQSPMTYSRESLMDLIREEIISAQELFANKVLTPDVYDAITNVSDEDLPNMDDAIAGSHATCDSEHTDVYLFGIPSTGKTCILMGLSSASGLSVNLAHSGGMYAQALQQYIGFGRTVPRTQGDFVTTLNAKIRDTNGAVHKVNLVEMSGEEFAFKIANNEEQEFSFEDMGTGVTELLTNNNRKVFFLIIDPTVNVVHITREKSYVDADGVEQHTLEYATANQKSVINKMVNLFEYPANAEIMKKVDAIHIIVTKADMLDAGGDREQEALQRFNARYQDIVDPLVALAKEYNINVSTNYRPKLYTFSLGKFYVGGIYQYDDTDSNRLVKAIRNSTFAIRKATWWDKFKKAVN